MRTPIVLLVMFFAACTRTVYVPQTEVHTEYRDRLKIDSVYVRDSIHVDRAGDTVKIYRDRWRDRWRIERDTVRKTDSIPYPVEVVREVKHIPKVYRWSLWVALAVVGWVILQIARKFRP